ncbi:hypothetical protein, partial [Deinococcus sp.]|uniref:hypothetical protein n=1 Tax=Deinococcus sp. TaxID=47478 RepID=UPI00286DF3B9
MTDVPPSSAPGRADASTPETGGGLSLGKTRVTSARLFGRSEPALPSEATEVTAPVAVPEMGSITAPGLALLPPTVAMVKREQPRL